jgi:hypothetical protein
MVWKNVKKNRKSDENNGNKNFCNVNILTSSGLSASAASGLGDNFSLGTLKNDFVALIYK